MVKNNIIKEKSRSVYFDDENKAVIELCVSGKIDKDIYLMGIPQLEIEFCDCNEDCCGCQCEDNELPNYEKMPTPRFGGAFYNEYAEFIYINKVVYNKDKGIVAVVWSDGTTTKATCDARDEWNAELGLTLAVMKKLTNGQDFVKNLLRDWVVSSSSGNIVRTLRDVRRDSKKNEKLGSESMSDDVILVKKKK